MSVENLNAEEARAKIKQLAESIDFAMMATGLDTKPIHTIPMSTKKVDAEGNIWFLSGNDSDHNQHIEASGNAQLMYADPSSMKFLVAYGNASISKDRRLLEELYGPTDDNWFNGVDDPNLTAIKFQPTDAHYWNPKDNSLVTLLKMGVGAVTGKKQDVGVSGDLDP